MLDYQMQGRRRESRAGGSAGGEGDAALRQAERLDERMLTRVRALGCETAPLVALEDHAAEERLRRRRLRPAASLLAAAAAGADAAAAKRTWAAVDADRIRQVFAPPAGGGVRDARAAEWLQRDAKCIDELLFRGVKAKAAKAKGLAPAP